MSTAVIYGSTTGNTKNVAEIIAEKMGADLFDVANTRAADLVQYENLILGTSTWGVGELQEDWEEGIDLLDDIDFLGKKVAIFGLGDQESYSDSFVDGIGIIYEKVKGNNGTVIGLTPVDGYTFTESLAVIGNQFVGLALDEENDPNLTSERIERWVEQLKNEMLQ